MTQVVVLMGVSGSGKTTVGRALAEATGWAFEDADDHHDQASLDKMAAGHGLTDAGRAPWLKRLGRLIRQRADEGPPTVLACSALRESYREVLGTGRADVGLAWLDVPDAVLARRLRQREGHVAGVDLLPSQLATLEPPAEAVRLDGTAPVAVLVAALRRAFEG